MKRWSVAAVIAAVVLLAGVVAYRMTAPRSESPRSERHPEPAAALPGGVVAPAAAHVDGPRFTRANVLIVTIDTLRRDHLAPYGAAFETPAASRLAREGVLFEHAVSHVPLTLPSHSSIFTGLYPPHHTVRDNGGFVVGKDVTTLAEGFRGAGYKTAGSVVCTSSLRDGASDKGTRRTTTRSTTRTSKAAPSPRSSDPRRRWWTRRWTGSATSAVTTPSTCGCTSTTRTSPTCRPRSTGAGRPRRTPAR